MLLKKKKKKMYSENNFISMNEVEKYSVVFGMNFWTNMNLVESKFLLFFSSLLNLELIQTISSLFLFENKNKACRKHLSGKIINFFQKKKKTNKKKQ